MYVLTESYGEVVVYKQSYDNLEEAKADLDAEFYCFTSDDNTIEYGSQCLQADDGMSAWAKLKGKCRIWRITEVLPERTCSNLDLKEK